MRLPASVAAVFLLFALVSATASAEQAVRFGPYEVHYNAITADVLYPVVAREYGIQRSRNRVVVTLAVRKLEREGTVPVPAQIQIQGTNLTGQIKSIDLRRIDDGEAIYYIADFPVAHREVIDFEARVQPEGAGREQTVTWRQQFFTQEQN